MAHDLGNACLGDANLAFPLFRLVSPLHHRLISNNYEAEWGWGYLWGYRQDATLGNHCLTGFLKVFSIPVGSRPPAGGAFKPQKLAEFGSMQPAESVHKERSVCVFQPPLFN